MKLFIATTLVAAFVIVTEAFPGNGQGRGPPGPPPFLTDFLAQNPQCQPFSDVIKGCMLGHMSNMINTNCGGTAGCPAFTTPEQFFPAIMQQPNSDCRDCLKSLRQNQPHGKQEHEAKFEEIKANCPEFQAFTDSNGCEALIKAAKDAFHGNN